MRERTPFPRAMIEVLPDLKLLSTTGARNNSFDLKAAAERGVTVCGTGGFGSPRPASSSACCWNSPDASASRTRG
jgi:lactate dehydrogenase-like 2-hydroxyacid dehydrogenase